MASSRLSPIFALLLAAPLSAAMAGGASAMDISDERLQNAVQAVVPQFQTMASAQGRNGLVSELNIVEAQSQVVAGINYFVKVHLGHDEYAHMRIYDHFGDVELTDIQLSKSKTDRLEYF